MSSLRINTFAKPARRSFFRGLLIGIALHVPLSYKKSSFEYGNTVVDFCRLEFDSSNFTMVHDYSLIVIYSRLKQQKDHCAIKHHYGQPPGYTSELPTRGKTAIYFTICLVSLMWREGATRISNASNWRK